MKANYKLFYSDFIQRYDNKKYPHEIDIVDMKTLTTATSFDYVCAKYKDNLRSNDNFISSNCVVFDFKLYPVKWTKQIVSNLKNGQLNCV